MLFAQLRSQGEQVDDAQIEALRERYGLGQPFYIQYGKWIKEHLAAQRLGPVDGMAKTGQGIDLESIGVDDCNYGGSPAGQLVYCDSDWRLFGHAPILMAGLYLEPFQLCWAGDTGFPLGVDHHVLGAISFRAERGWTFFPGIYPGALELGQGDRFAEAHLDPLDHCRRRQYGGQRRSPAPTYSTN